VLFEVRVQPEVDVDRFALRTLLNGQLMSYSGRVSSVVMRLEKPNAQGKVRCRIDVQATWWGKLSVDSTDPDAYQSVDRSLAQLKELLNAFVLDIPA
jgi:hypothetical protein